MEFMISALRRLKAGLPPVAAQAVTVADRFFSGHATPSELSDARVSCWQWLGEIEFGREEVVPERCAVRAAICALFAEPTGVDELELLEFFARMLRCAGASHEDILMSLTGSFGTWQES